MREGSLFSRLLSLIVCFGIGASFAFPPSAKAEAVFPSGFRSCSRIFGPFISAADATPFIRKWLNRKLSAKWLSRFDYGVYRQIKARYLAVPLEEIEFDSWGFAESNLAYLEVLVEKTTGMPLDITSSVLDDPSYARKLQLLTSGMDFTQPMTRYDLNRILDRAYLLTNRLDLTFYDLRHLKTERVRQVMREHIYKEIAKEGIAKLFAEKGFFTKPTLWNRLLQIYESPATTAALLIPTWGTVLSNGQPGLLPKAQWIRIPKKDVRRILEVGIDRHLPRMEPGLRRALAFQRSYDYLRTSLAIVAGAMTVTFAISDYFGEDSEKLESDIKRQFENLATRLDEQAEELLQETPPPAVSNER